MNRRGFIAAIAGALAFDPERALWVPGKVISIPKPRARNVIQLGVEFDMVRGQKMTACDFGVAMDSLRLRIAALQCQVMAKAEFMGAEEFLLPSSVISSFQSVPGLGRNVRRVRQGLYLPESDRFIEIERYDVMVRI